MNKVQFTRMQKDQGFIAALDQSGGSTPKALMSYGVMEDSYANEKEMFDLVHQMRSRIIESPVFTKDRILAAILFERTMDSKIEGQYTADFLWNVKGIIPILKVDKGLKEIEDGVQIMKDMPDLISLLERANERKIFGTKMRSVIKEANPQGIARLVSQQFEIAKTICKFNLVPIIEPEVDINIKDKAEAEVILKKELIKQMANLKDNELVMFKLTLPEVDNFYEELTNHKNIVRVVALSGGYTREFANEKLSKNHKVIASFSRALSQGLNVNQSESEFDEMLDNSIKSIFEASIT